MRLDRDKKTFIPHLGPMSFGNAEHDALAWTIDVGVQNPALGTEAVQGEREIDRGGGLSDAALAGGDGNDVLRAGDASCFGRMEFQVEGDVFAEPIGDGARVVSFDPVERVAETHLRVPLSIQAGHAPDRAQLAPGRGENRIAECLQGPPFRRHFPRPAPFRHR